MLSSPNYKLEDLEVDIHRKSIDNHKAQDVVKIPVAQQVYLLPNSVTVISEIQHRPLPST